MVLICHTEIMKRLYNHQSVACICTFLHSWGCNHAINVTKLSGILIFFLSISSFFSLFGANITIQSMILSVFHWLLLTATVTGKFGNTMYDICTTDGGPAFYILVYHVSVLAIILCLVDRQWIDYSIEGSLWHITVHVYLHVASLLLRFSWEIYTIWIWHCDAWIEFVIE